MWTICNVASLCVTCSIVHMLAIRNVYSSFAALHVGGAGSSPSTLTANQRSMGRLPTYKGYIVDYRLKQFRSQPEDHGIIEFIEFGDEKGDELLVEMLRQNLVPDDVLGSLL